MSRSGFVKNAARFVVLLACLLTIWQPATLYAQSGDDIQAMKRKVSELIKQQNYTEALPLLEKLAVAEPNNADTQFYLGFALIAQANNTKDPEARQALRVRARAAFVKAKELGVDQPVVSALIGSIPPDGSENLTYSENAEASKLMAEAEGLFSQGKLDDALKIYKKALQLDPKLYLAALYSGDVYVQRGDFAQAETWYKKAIEIDPNRETAYRYSATPLMKQGKYAEARDRYIEAYISEPYSRFSAAGLTQWAQATNSTFAHPEIDIPPGDTSAENGDANVEPVGKDDGSSAWSAYGATRAAWRKEKFAKTFPQEKTYRHSLAEEADALRSVLALAAADQRVKTLSPSLVRLKKLNDDGLLDAYILLARPDAGIAQDHPGYLRQNRDKLRRYVVQTISTGTGAPENARAAGDRKQAGHDETIEREYDQAKDQTTLKLQMTPVTCVEGACIFFSLESSSPGAKPVASPERVVLALYIFTKTLRPFADTTLTALINGEAVGLGAMTFAGESSKDGLTGMAYGIVLDEKALAQLAAARKVEMRIGGLRFGFPENKLKAIADFYSQSKPGQ